MHFILKVLLPKCFVSEPFKMVNVHKINNIYGANMKNTITGNVCKFHLTDFDNTLAEKEKIALIGIEKYTEDKTFYLIDFGDYCTSGCDF